MTAGAVRVFEEICTLARLNAGRVFPSYNRLAEATALGRATVARTCGARTRRLPRPPAPVQACGRGGPTLCPDVQRLSPDGSATLAAPPAALDDPGADP
ncbi:hypothetical protein ACFSHP_20210 [Novosphingobium panipatense]